MQCIQKVVDDFCLLIQKWNDHKISLIFYFYKRENSNYLFLNMRTINNNINKQLLQTTPKFQVFFHTQSSRKDEQKD